MPKTSCEKTSSDRRLFSTMPGTFSRRPYLGRYRSMKEANAATLRRIAGFAPGSTLMMTFMVPAELLDDGDRADHRATASKAKAAGTPFVSSFSPGEMLALARSAGFRTVTHVSGDELNSRYFADRADGLRIAKGEEFLVATT